MLHYYFDDFVRSGGSHHRLAVRIVWHDSLSISMNVAAYTVKKGRQEEGQLCLRSGLNWNWTVAWSYYTFLHVSHTLPLSLSLLVALFLSCAMLIMSFTVLLGYDQLALALALPSPSSIFISIFGHNAIIVDYDFLSFIFIYFSLSLFFWLIQ